MRVHFSPLFEWQRRFAQCILFVKGPLHGLQSIPNVCSSVNFDYILVSLWRIFWMSLR